MSLADELRKLQELRDAGTISEAEFERAKAAVLGGTAPGGIPGAPPPPLPPTVSLEEQTRQWAMFLHFSQLIGCVLPIAGLIVPIILWQVKKDELPGIDPHGKNVVNWIISAVIYIFVSAILSVVVIGIPFLIALLVLLVVFPIVGGIKAGNGEVWKYPLSITFLQQLSPQIRS
jgi:uncharacterized Tic20 family protein